MKSFLRKRMKSSETTTSGLSSKKATQTDPKCNGKGEKKKIAVGEVKPHKSTEKLIKRGHVSREMQAAKKKPEKVLQNTIPKSEVCKSSNVQNHHSQERKQLKSQQYPKSLLLEKKQNSTRKQELTNLDQVGRRTLRAKSANKKRGVSRSQDRKQNLVVPEAFFLKKSLKSIAGVPSPPLNEDTLSSSGIDSFVTAAEIEPDIMDICGMERIGLSVSNEKPSSEVTRDINVLKLDDLVQKDKDGRIEKGETQFHQNKEQRVLVEDNKNESSKSYHKKQSLSAHHEHSGMDSSKDKNPQSALCKIKDNQSGRSHAIREPLMQKTEFCENVHNVKESEDKSLFKTEKCDTFNSGLTCKSPFSKNKEETSKIDINSQTLTAEVHQNHTVGIVEHSGKIETKDGLIEDKQAIEQQNNQLACNKTNLPNARHEVTSVKLTQPTDPSHLPSNCNRDGTFELKDSGVSYLTNRNPADVFANTPLKTSEGPAAETFEQLCHADSETRASQLINTLGNFLNKDNKHEKFSMIQPEKMASRESIIIQNTKTYVPNKIATSCSGVSLHESHKHEEVPSRTVPVDEACTKFLSEELNDLVGDSTDTSNLSEKRQVSHLSELPITESEESGNELPSSYIIVYPDKNAIHSPQTLVEKALKLKSDRLSSQIDRESQDTFLDEIRDICEEILEAKIQKLQKKVFVDETSFTNSYGIDSNGRSRESTNDSRKSGGSEVSEETQENDCSRENTIESRKSRVSEVSKESQETGTSECSNSTEDSKDSEGSKSSKTSKASEDSKRSEDSKDSEDSKCSEDSKGTKYSQDSECSQDTAVSKASHNSGLSQRSQESFDSQQNNTLNRDGVVKIKTTVCEIVSVQKFDLKGSADAVQKCEEENHKTLELKEKHLPRTEFDTKNQGKRELESTVSTEKQATAQSTGFDTDKIEISSQKVFEENALADKENSKDTNKSSKDRECKLKRKSSYDHWVTVSKHGKFQDSDFREKKDKLPENCYCEGKMFDSLETNYCDLSPKSNKIDKDQSAESICGQREPLMSLSEPSNSKKLLDVTHENKNGPCETFKMKIESPDSKEIDSVSSNVSIKNGDLDKKLESTLSKCKLKSEKENAADPFKTKEIQVSEYNNEQSICKSQEPEVNKCKHEVNNILEKDMRKSAESAETKVSETAHEKTISDLTPTNSPNESNLCLDRDMLTSQMQTSNTSPNLNKTAALPSGRPKTSNDVGGKKQNSPDKILRKNKKLKPAGVYESTFLGTKVVYRRESKQSILNTTEGVLKVPTQVNKQNVTVLFEELLPLSNQAKSLRDAKTRDIEQVHFQNAPKHQFAQAEYNHQYMPHNFDARQKSQICSSAALSPFRLQMLPPATKRQDFINKPQKVSSLQTSREPYDAYYESYRVTIPNEQQVVTAPLTRSSNQQEFSDGGFTPDRLETLCKNSASQPPFLQAEALNSPRMCTENMESLKLKPRNNEVRELDEGEFREHEHTYIYGKTQHSASPQSPSLPRVQKSAESKAQQQKNDVQNTKSVTIYENHFEPNRRKSSVSRIKSCDDLNRFNSSAVNHRSVGSGPKSYRRQSASVLDTCSRCGIHIEESGNTSADNSTINSKDSDLVSFCKTLHLQAVDSEATCALCIADSSTVVIPKTSDSKCHIPSNVNIFNQTSQDVCIACEVGKIKEKRDSAALSGICNTPEKKLRKRTESRHTVHFDPQSVGTDDDESNSVNPVQTCTSFVYHRTKEDCPERSPVKVKSEPAASITKANENGKRDENCEKNLEAKAEISSSSQLQNSVVKPAVAIKPSFACCPSLERANKPKPNSEKMETKEAAGDKNGEDSKNLIVLPFTGCKTNVYIDEPGMYELHLVLSESEIKPSKSEESTTKTPLSVPIKFCPNPNDCSSDSDEA